VLVVMVRDIVVEDIAEDLFLLWVVVFVVVVVVVVLLLLTGSTVGGRQ